MFDICLEMPVFLASLYFPNCIWQDTEGDLIINYRLHMPKILKHTPSLNQVNSPITLLNQGHSSTWLTVGIIGGKGPALSSLHSDLYR